MTLKVTYEDVAWLSRGPEVDPAEFELERPFLEAFVETSRAEGLLPERVVDVLSATAYPDDSVYRHGRRQGSVKLFASIDLAIEADGEDDLPAIDALTPLLTKLVDAMDTELSLEGIWEYLGHEPLDEVEPGPDF